VDWALDHQVGTGRFQYVYILLLGSAYGFCSANTYAEVFVTMNGDKYLPPWSWHTDCGADVSSCPVLSASAAGDCRRVPLEQWAPDAHGRSIVADFKLICSNGWKLPLLGSIYFAGFGAGLLVCGQISDTLGRKRGYLFSAGCMAAGGILAAASWSWASYAVARAIVGFGVAGAGNTSFVWLTEYLNPELRPVMAWFPNVAFCVAQALPSALGVGIYGWRSFLLAVNLISLSGLLYAPCMRESPRWLAMKGRHREAYEVVRRVAAANGVPEPPPPPQAQAHRAADEGAGAKGDGVRAVCAQLCSRRLGLRFLLMSFSWFSITFAFYGLGFFSPNLPFNAYAANAVNAVSSVPFYLVGQPLIESRLCGRKGAVVGGFVLGGAGLLISTCIKSTVGSLLVYYAANGALCMAFGIIYVWSSELFPTSMRGRVMSYLSLAGRVGAIVAPYVVKLGETRPAVALALFAAPSLFSGAFDLLLPETRGRRLPATFEEMPPAGRCSGGAAQVKTRLDRLAMSLGAFLMQDLREQAE